MNPARVLGRVMHALLPWPPRHQRKAAIEGARREKEASLRGAAQAAAVEAEIGHLAARNHFAASIARQIAMRQQGEGT